jgi:transcription elongation factor GreB
MVRRPPPRATRDDEDEEEGPRRPAPNYITPEGYRKMTEEHDLLRFKTRREVVDALAAAAAEGDRSENAEYTYRKRQLRQIDSRVRFLARRLDRAVVVDPRDQQPRDRVFFGATVVVEDEEGRRSTYRLLGSDEIGSGRGAISWQSPVGRALLGKAVGDTVVVRVGAGERELTVVSIA